MTEKQLAIVLAAVPAFERQGFSGVSMEQIASAARVSKRTLYRHYPNKEAVFSAIITYLRKERRIRPFPTFKPSLEVPPQLNALVRAMCENLNDNDRIRLTRIIIPELVHNHALSEGFRQDLDWEDVEPFRWIEAAMRHGALRRADPGLALRQLAALVKAEVLWPRLTMGRPALDDAEIDRITRECASFFLAHYLPAET